MTGTRAPEDARYWLNEAKERLEDARTRAGVPGSSVRVRCEQAHYACEFALKGVIIARGRSFATTHNIQELLDTARAAGEAVPAGVEEAEGLTTYSGAGRYEFDRDPEQRAVDDDEYERAVKAAETTVAWAEDRIEHILDAR